MSNEWSKVEITPTTTQKRSSAEVESDYALQNMEITATTRYSSDISPAKQRELDAFKKELEAYEKRNAERLKAADETMGVQGLKKFLAGNGLSPSSAEKAMRSVAEQKIWDSIPITFESKQLKSAAAVIGEFGNKSGLDQALKSLPSLKNANLEDLARGNVGLELGNVVNAFSGLFGNKTDAIKNQVQAATSMIPDLTGVGMFGGGGISGIFNPAGLAIGASDEPSVVGYTALAKTVFTSGASEAGEVVDIYRATINSPQNKIKTVLSDVMDVVGGALGGTLSKTLRDVAGKANILDGLVNADSAKNIMNRFKSDLLSGVPLSKENLVKGLYESVGYDGKSLNFQGGLKGLGDNMLADITKQIDGQTGLLTMYDNVKVIVKGDYDTAEGIFKILENVTGNSAVGGFLDVTNKFKIINGVTKSLIGLGAPELFDKVIEKIDHANRKDFIRENLAEALAVGDVSFVDFSFKEVNGGWILANYPNAITDIVSNFTPNLEADDQISVAQYDQLVGTLNRIDPNWDNIGTRNGVVLYDYNTFSKFNNQARLAIVAGGNRNHIAALIASEGFTETYNNLTELQQRFNYYPII